MNVGTDALQFVVVAVHAEGMDAHALDGFRNGVTEVVKRVEQRIKEKQSDCRFSVQVLEFGGSRRDSGIGSRRARSQFLDVSEIDEKLTLCAGRLQGAGVPLIFVGGMGSESVVKRLHRGISDIVLYHSTNEFFQTNSAFETELFRAVPETRIQEELIFRFWFPRGTSTIWIVCPQDHDPSPYADRSDPDYTYLDNLG